jgi:hypothetical protein
MLNRLFKMGPVLHRIVEPMLGPRAGSRMNSKVWSPEQ